MCVCVSQWLHIRDRPIDYYKNYKNPHTPHSTMVHIRVGTWGRGGIGAMVPQISESGPNGIWPHRFIDLFHFCDLRVG